jgi:uncharacterized membrane protein
MLPFGLLSFGQFSDFMLFYTGTSEWLGTAFYAYLVGTIAAVAAAVPGLVDHASLLDRRARSASFLHMMGGFLVIALMSVSLYLRWDLDAGSPLAMFVASAAYFALLGTVVLGLYLVHHRAVGVSTEAESGVSEVPGALSSGPIR